MASHQRDLLRQGNSNTIENGDDASSSDDDSANDEADDSQPHSRNKRDVFGHVTKAYSRSVQRCYLPSTSIVWPPNPSNVDSYKWRNLRPVRMGNPLFGNRMQLFSRTNYNLAVYPDGAVRGTQDDSDIHTHLELISAEQVGHVRIKGMLSNLYVAMDKKGRLYGEPNMTEPAAVFIESFQGSYKTYLSLKYAHLGWYLGIKKSGKFKRGPKTAFNQKAVQFLSRRSKFQ